MKFEEYRENADEEWKKFRENVPQTVSQQERDRFYQSYINWDIQETNKKLVVATWFLVIVNVILSFLTLFL